MAGKIVFRIGMSLEEIDREIVATVAATERGESFEAKRIISFENWTTFFRSMTANRIAVLQHVAARDVVASVRELAIGLSRDYAAVHADVAELVQLGLLERDGRAIRCEIKPDRAELAAA